MAELYDREFIYRKPKRNKTVPERRLVFTVTVSLIICVAVFIFASLNGNSAKIILSADEVYAVSMGSFSSEEAALRFSAVLQQRGGAGYVYFEEKYFVLAVCFPDIKDAGSVASKLVSAGETAEIVKISSPKTTVSFEGSGKESEILKKALDLFPEVFEELSGISLNFDKGLISLNDVVTKTNALISRVDSAVSSLAEMKKTNGSKLIKPVADGLDALLGMLLDLRTSRQDSACIKKCALAVFLHYKEFKNNLTAQYL